MIAGPDLLPIAYPGAFLLGFLYNKVLIILQSQEKVKM